MAGYFTRKKVEELIDGIYYYGADADKRFVRIANRLLECSKKGDFDYHCPRCNNLSECLSAFTSMSGKSSLAALKPADEQYYARWFRAIVQRGIVI